MKYSHETFSCEDTNFHWITPRGAFPVELNVALPFPRGESAAPMKSHAHRAHALEDYDSSHVQLNWSCFLVIENVYTIPSQVD